MRRGEGREAVVVALAREIDQAQQRDRSRLLRYEQAAQQCLSEFRRLPLRDLPLVRAHELVLTLAERHLPTTPRPGESDDATAQ
ncbi:MAG: hypothetical protein GEV06_26865 [Luteitalea sp.]|nr:hypothetical protein [Luteitalea sp.]